MKPPSMIEQWRSLQACIAADKVISGRMPAVERDRWFVQEILAHDDLLKDYLARCGLQPADAEDVCQEVYRRFLELLPESRPQSGKGFALTAVRNLRIDRRRCGWSRFVRLVCDPEVFAPADELDPARHAIGASDLEALQRALEQLPPRRRQVFWLRRIENQSLRQIAQLLEISNDAVEAHLTLALRTLRVCGFYPL